MIDCAGKPSIIDGMKQTIFQAREIFDNIWQIEEYGVFCYLVAGSERALLIDTGTGFGDLAEFAAALTPLPVTAAATHAHPDHIGGRGAFKTLCLPQEEFGLARFYGSLFMRRMMFSKAAQKTYRTKRSAIRKGKYRTKYLPLKGEERFDLGGRTVECIRVPGHTKDGMMFLCRAEKLLFTGDDLCRALWLFLPGALSVSEWAENAERIRPFLGEYTLYSAHDREPQDPALMKKLIETAHRLVREQKNTLLPRVRVYPKEYTDHGILYRTDRVRKKRD